MKETRGVKFQPERFFKLLHRHNINMSMASREFRPMLNPNLGSGLACEEWEEILVNLQNEGAQLKWCICLTSLAETSNVQTFSNVVTLKIMMISKMLFLGL